MASSAVFGSYGLAGVGRTVAVRYNPQLRYEASDEQLGRALGRYDCPSNESPSRVYQTLFDAVYSVECIRHFLTQRI